MKREQELNLSFFKMFILRPRNGALDIRMRVSRKFNTN